MKNFPEILLLGNGINRHYGNYSWTEFLKSISNENYKCYLESAKAPMPLKAILLTGNSVNAKLKDKKADLMPNSLNQDKDMLITSLLSLNFDEILTTNYTYELEQIAFNNVPLSATKLRNLMHHTNSINHAETKYLLHTYNQVKYGERPQRIWHIHGEARKPDSMAIDHYYYSNLLHKIKEHSRETKNRYQLQQLSGRDIDFKSWIDAFIIGNVYILGQGLDFSEMDLWWLLDRKNREKAEHGQVYFYEPYKTIHEEKYQLLKLFNVIPEHLGTTKETDAFDYLLFYKKAICDIETKIKKHNFTKKHN